MSRKTRPDALTLERQRRAADPSRSIWVSANAGSGKTHVLTMRVLRLLLAGVAPEEILCLTYTKAAAAEMRRRVAAQLADWALREDEGLDAGLAALQPDVPVTEALRLRARTLFAHALETPGGLKIVTIHAFCESVLHRFPLEARVPIDFSVIEDDERAGLILAAREGVLADGLKGDPEVAPAVAHLFETLSDSAIGAAIDAALGEIRKLRPLLADRPAAKARLRRLVGYDGRTREAILAGMTAGRLLDAAAIGRILALSPPKPDADNFESRLARLDPATPDPEAWRDCFLTKEQEPRKTLCNKAARTADPALAELCVAEAERLAGLCVDLRRAALVERSEALLDVLGAIVARYEARKRARSLLDFDDLIETLARLLGDREMGPWVQYKLDAGITHILVDESQDTNAEQWKVVRAIADEFFAGAGAVARPRTLFAVGDEKQSIYSFQGADPALFGETGAVYRARAGAAGHPFEPVPLRASFRTLPAILDAVDTVMARQDIRAALLAPPDQPVQHSSARLDPGGLVVLWPPVQQQAQDREESGWPLEPASAEQTAPRQVAERIASTIRAWIDAGRPLARRGRPVGADDVLILVQTRSALFFEIIRALRRHRLPTPGADRLSVTTHIAVLDLLALGDVLLNPADDLQLAALLRSPLFDVSEDDLFALAQPRADGQRLWSALQASPDGPCAEAYRKLHAWRGQLDFERPFEFYAHVLAAEGGRKRFHARLGPEVDDVFAAFLDLALAHEQSGQPSLQGFLRTLRGQAVSIKRELAEAGGGVRVMTVHGAKGLEAPIVFLADAASAPSGRQLTRPLHIVEAGGGPVLIHAGARADHVPESLVHRQAAEDRQRAEYWRKLYVAMTRAEDELYVTGPLTAGTKAETQLAGTWYQAIEEALTPLGQVLADAEGNPAGLVYPAPDAAAEPGPGAGESLRPEPAGEPEALDLPPLPPHEDRLIVSPSSAHGQASIERAFDTALDAFADAEAARREGLALHALLQHLGRVPPGQRDRVLARAMPVLLPDAPERHAALADKARSILDKPDFAFLFGPHSRAEVPFVHDFSRHGRPVRLAGRIDRLVVEPGRVTVVDYKSDRAPPADSDAVPAPYVTQLGLYARVAQLLFPNHDVRAAILWTSLESLMILPPGQLAAATAAFTKE